MFFLLCNQKIQVNVVEEDVQFSPAPPSSATVKPVAKFFTRPKPAAQSKPSLPEEQNSSDGIGGSSLDYGSQVAQKETQMSFMLLSLLYFYYIFYFYYFILFLGAFDFPD
eukprot:EG_transcript_43354